MAILWCDHSIEISLTVPPILSHGTLRFLVFYVKFRIFIEVLFGKQNLWVLRRINISCWERLRLIWLSHGDFSVSRCQIAVVKVGQFLQASVSTWRSGCQSSSEGSLRNGWEVFYFKRVIFVLILSKHCKAVDYELYKYQVLLLY